MKHILRILLLMLFIPFGICAYTSDQYYINAEVKDNGDLYVQEYYVLNGTYNGSYDTIYYKNNANDFKPSIEIAGYSNIYNGSGVRIESVKSVNIIDNFDFNKMNGDSFMQVSNANKGDYGVYTNEYLSGGNRLMIFMPSTYKRAFYVSYTISDMVVVHNDVAELWWKRFDSSSLTESVSDFQIKIKLPGNTNEFRVWAHGPLNGIVQKNGTDEYYASISGMSAYQDVSFRTTFDKSVVSKSAKYSNIDGLPSILAFEEDSAGEANYERQVLLQSYKDEYVEVNNTCLNYASHTCYNRLIELRATIIDNEFLSVYEDDFNTIKINVIKNDIANANNAVERTKESLRYSDYTDAVELVNYLPGEDDELYDKLTIELNNLKKVITEKEEARVQNASMLCVCVGAIIAVSFIAMKIYYKNCYKKFFDHDYYREIPNVSLTSASLLMEDKIDGDTVSANILELANRGIIKVTPLEKMNYLFEYDTEVKKDLTKKERELIDLIFAGSNKAELKDIKKHSHRELYSYLLAESYDNYKLEGDREYRREGYLSNSYVLSSKSKINIAQTVLGILSFFVPVVFLLPFICVSIYKYIITHTRYSLFKILMVIACIIASLVIIAIPIYVNIINGISKLSFMIPFVSIVITVIILISTISQKVYSEKGYQMIGQLKGLKNFLNDFSIIEDRDLPEITLWGNYMVFALLFGISDKLAKVMRIKIGQIETLPFYDFDMFDNFDYIGRNVYNTGTAAHNIIARHNASVSFGNAASSAIGGAVSSIGSWSSGGGGGGGFSSHSSGGGGGGGIGRF